MSERAFCGQRGCGAEVVWARTVRQLDEASGKMKGGRPMMVDWPLPVLRTEAGRLLPGAPGEPVPNLGVKKDQHGSWVARVLTESEPLRAEERAGIPHWATCKNPPQRRSTTRRPRTQTRPAVGQDTLALDLPTGAAVAEPGPLSDQRLFPRRRTRRG